MFNSKSVLVAAVTFALTAPSVFAAESEVTWTNPDKYRDVKASQMQNSKKFKENTFKRLEEHFAKLAEKLPEGQKLSIDVTDVDLAGDVNAGGIERIRIVKEIYSPRIKFSYELTDKDGQSLVAGEINLKDMNFMSTSRLKYRNDNLGYEKKMLDDWFAKTFAERISK
mgnify:CR=1 FL=1